MTCRAFLNTATATLPKVIIDLYYKECLHCEKDYSDEVRADLAEIVAISELVGGKSVVVNYKRTALEPKWHAEAVAMCGADYDPSAVVYRAVRTARGEITVERKAYKLDVLARHLNGARSLYDF